MTHMRNLTGSLAALIIIMAATTGAAAQATDAEPISVTLAGGLCGFDVFGSDGNFGRWEFVWPEYQETSGNGTVAITAQLQVNKRTGCDVNVSFSGLMRLDGNVAIGMENFTAAYNGDTRDPAGWSETGVMSTNLSFDFTLKEVPFETKSGTYGGYITVLVTDTV